MQAMRRLDVEIPEELAAWVQAQVKSGRFQSESDAVSCAMTLVREQDDEPEDPEVEAWLRDVVVPRYAAWKESGQPGLTIDEVRASLARRRAERQQPDAAE